MSLTLIKQVYKQLVEVIIGDERQLMKANRYVKGLSRQRGTPYKLKNDKITW